MLKKYFYSLIVATVIFSAFALESHAADDNNTDAVFDTTSAVADANLDEMRGAALNPEMLGIAIFDAVSSNNTANGTYSGGNVISDNAFSDSSGLSTIIQNSGNNVLIQSATILNLNID